MIQVNTLHMKWINISFFKMRKIIGIIAILLIFICIGTVNAEDISLDEVNSTNIDNISLDEVLVENTSHTHYVVSEEKAILLIILVAYLCKILTHN